MYFPLFVPLFVDSVPVQPRFLIVVNVEVFFQRGAQVKFPLGGVAAVPRVSDTLVSNADGFIWTVGRCTRVFLF